MKIKCRDTGEVVRSYAEYLKTTHWRTVREIAFVKSRGVCLCCGKPILGDFVAHHRTYRRVGRERIRVDFSKNLALRVLQKLRRDDVVAVCKNCHDGAGHERLHEFVFVPKWARKEKN